ncbi:MULTISPECIES: TRAP transporter substrate-binding protein [unclassified Shinella]|uniref:TRAP transporter substrate-binding protein n=1 Tax=unclassified Shinella TaxID=2643062 RepID=UPI00225D0513|nr:MULTISPECIES: TRAP transporter substrate-binding protein [unclassified Shinella]MCO5139228.1 TRAP transporter substrate-binding protein [Shinella sp.]MDC7256043.1 TRAP transporter substrate-binding protein [Shinella sp. YE25]CAI0338880.1 Bacterial extracellular solute-binding, 7 family protein [Rhizobiaceae bacterium]CAK7257307.1 TRAP-type transport system periplasmic protein [Shinella sp. WSC3-e]
MEFTRRTFMATAGIALAAPAVLKSTIARAQEAVTLRLHHFLPPAANVHQHLLMPWAKTLADESDGKLTVEIFPAMQLGGKPPQLYDQAVNGVVDIVWTLPGNTPGRFPSTEVFELPFVAAQKASVNAPACEEYSQAHVVPGVTDTKILCFWAHDHGLIHSNTEIRTKEDLAGLKLRNPTRLAGEALGALGATPVGMPIPQIPDALAQRAIDGCVVPWEVVPSLKIDELTSYHLEIPGTPTLYTATFFLAMNRARYEGLAPELREILDRNSGLAFANAAGEMWDRVGAEVRAKVEAGGKNKVTTISEEEKARWLEATAPVRDTWVADMKAKGLDGEALLKAAQDAIQKYAKA